MSKQDLSDLEIKKRELRDEYGKSLLSKKEFCKELGCSVASLDRMRLRSEIRSRKVLGQIKFTIEDVASYLVHWK